MRLGGWLHAASGGPAMLASAALALAIGAACGGGGSQSPTPTPPPTPAAVPAASPQRPALASPVANPSPAAPASATTSSGATTGTEQSYEIQPGDTLLSIAEQFYSDATAWRPIYDANKDVIGDNPDALKVGTKLKIPPKAS